MSREGEIKNDVSPLTVQYANAAAVAAGEVIAIPGVGVGIACEAGDASESIAYQIRGLVQFPITSAVTISQGNRCYWDISESKVLKTGMALGDLDLGVAAQAGTASGGYVQVDLNAPLTIGNISVYDAGGFYKRSYTTVDLAVAALVATDILKIKSGEYTLTSALSITATDCQIIGEGKVTIVGFAGADHCFKTVFGAISSTKSITIKNITFDHGDDATQYGINIDNASATGRINAILEDVSGESDGGDTIHVTHTSTNASIRLYVTGGTFEGPVNFVVGHTDDRIRFEGSTLRGGLVTGTSATAMEICLNKCLVLHEGVTGGHSSQLLYAAYCLSETDANPNVYAALDTSDLAGSHTESLLFPAS